MAATTGKVRSSGTPGTPEVEPDVRPGPAPENPGFMEMLRGRANSELNARKDRVSDTLDVVAHTMRRISEPLRDQPYPAIAGYAETAAGRIEGLAAGLRQRDVLELADDLRGAARERPGAFVAAGFAVGVLAGRFLKSSAGDQGDTRATAPRGGRVAGSTTSQGRPASERR